MSKKSASVTETPAPESTPSLVDIGADAAALAESMPEARPMGNDELMRISETVSSVAEKKRRGRPKGSKNSAPGSVAMPVDASQPVNEAAIFASQISALFNGVLVATLGEDSALIKAEREALDQSLACYMASKNVQMTPGVALAVTLGGIVATRITTKPTARSRLALGWQWLKSKFSRKPKLTGDNNVTP